MLTQEEMQQLKNLLDAKLESKLRPINNKLDDLQRAVNILTEGAISTVSGVDALNDEEREKSKHNHH